MELIVFGEVKVIGDRCYVFILAGCCFGWASVPLAQLVMSCPADISSALGHFCGFAFLCFLDLACGRLLLPVHSSSGVPLVLRSGHIDICLPCILLDAFTNFLWLLLMHVHSILSVVD